MRALPLEHKSELTGVGVGFSYKEKLKHYSLSLFAMR